MSIQAKFFSGGLKIIGLSIWTKPNADYSRIAVTDSAGSWLCPCLLISPKTFTLLF